MYLGQDFPNYSGPERSQSNRSPKRDIQKVPTVLLIDDTPDHLLILGDIFEEEGFQVRYAEDCPSADLPVPNILMTAQPGSVNIIEAMAAGCDDFWENPIHPYKIRAQLKKFFAPPDEASQQ